MAFTKTPAGATTNYLLEGTAGIDITTVPGNNTNVTIQALGDADQVTIQSTDGVANGFLVEMGDGADRIFADSDPNNNGGAFYFVNSTIRGGAGEDIIFGTEAGGADSRRTNYLQDSLLNGNQGQDIIRNFGMLTSRIEGGQDGDTVELVALQTNFAPVTTVNPIPRNPDRFDGASVQGSRGNDTISLTLGRSNFVNSKINGNEDDDLITNNLVDLSGNWQNSTIFGGQGSDTISLQLTSGGFVSSSLLVLGNLGADYIATGNGNDTVIGGAGSDSISIQAGANLIYGDDVDASGSGDDTIVVNLSNTPVSRTSQNTVYAGDGNDTVLINTDGNNTVVADATGLGGDDTVNIVGAGNNSVLAGVGNDTVQIVGGGSNTIYGGAGDDTLNIGTPAVLAVAEVPGRDQTIFQEDGDDVSIVIATGASSISGGSGADSIQLTGVTGTTGTFRGGIGADTINIDDAGVRRLSVKATYIQADGDSVVASSVTNLNANGNYQANTVIDFGANASAGVVDVITGTALSAVAPLGSTGFTVATDLLKTTLGDLGLDAQRNGGAGGLYAGWWKDGGVERTVNGSSGMVTGRSYFFEGDYNTTNGEFTLADNGADTLLVTNGNNGAMTSNSNGIVLQGFSADAAALLTSSNFDQISPADFAG